MAYQFLLVETTDAEPGAALMISRIIDLAVIRTLRTWVHLGRTSGWLAGLADPRIARALKVMHERPLQRWSVETLSDVAGMSRSSFCERFNALVGRSPLRYQNEWRLNLARDMLAAGDGRVGEIGLRVPDRALDHGIVQTLWLSLDEVRASQARHRSPLVLQCIEDFLAGLRYPLDIVRRYAPQS